MFKKSKTYIKILLSVIVLAIAFLTSYLVILPAVVSSPKFVSALQTGIKKSLHADLKIENPQLTTELSPNITFSVKNFELTKDNNKLINIKNFNLTVSFKELLDKKINIKKLGADYIYVDVNKLKLLNIKQEEAKEQPKSDWKIDLLHSLLYIKESVILYELPNKVEIKILGKDLEITESRNPKFVRFNINVEIEKNKEKIILAINDNNNVFIDQKKLFVKNCVFYINQSPIYINYIGSENKDFEVQLHSDKFNIKDVVDIVNTNLLIPNGEELLAMLSDIDGSFDFKVQMGNSKTKGELNLHSFSFKVPMLNNIPVMLNNGRLHISDENILLKDFKGFYGKSTENSIDMTGIISDYLTTFKTDIVAYVVGTKEFTNNYLTQTIGFPLELVGKTTAKVKFGMLDNKMDLAIIFRLIKGYDILVDGSSLSPVNYERAFRADMQLSGTNLELKNLNYYIADSFQAGVVAKPILKLYGNFDMAKNMDIKNIGFEIPKPLPSEFLNLLIGERVFRKGTISGHLEYLNNKLVPYLDGYLAMNGVLVPSQRLSIREGNLKTSQNNTIDIDIKGRYKRADYQFGGYIANQLKLPIVVNKINMKIDNIDVERIMQSFNKQAEQNANLQEIDVAKNLAATEENENINDDEVVFNTNLIIIKDCLLEIVKGVYKEIDFDNVKANMTLDENGILQINSNRFNIAEGISSAKIFLDLKNQQYKIKLGIKDVNADKIATSLLALPREISGKAKGFIILETDKNFKLNGSMKFDIKNGTIAKIGLVEYAIKFVSLFRNPLAMISPAVIMDLVNIPEGNFDNINGELKLKDNIIEKIMIKSTAPQLSSFIIGKYDLESRDATLRVYTKFSNKDKGFSGFLRNISLNSLANRISLGSRNDSNYYATELSLIPPIDAEEKDCQVFLTKIDGDVERNNFLSSLKRIK